MIPRNFLFGVLTAILICAAVEGFSFLGVSYLHRSWMTHRDIIGLQRDRMDTPAPVFEIDTEDERPHPTVGDNVVIHPYIGFVPTPESGTDRSPPGEAASYGFPNNSQGIFHRRSPETLIVALFGGSVAWGFPPSARDALEDILTAAGRYQGRELIFVNLAYPGYKQPQQLMILNYLLALGAEFDMVINLDGFNEVTLPVNENLHKGVFPFFPRSWFFRVGKFDPETRVAVGEIAFLEDRRVALAEQYSSAPFRYSMTAGLVWTMRDRVLSNRISERNMRLASLPWWGSSYLTTGPPVHYENDEEMLHDFALMWKRCSLAMNHLCAGYQTEYVHCLQPTLQKPGSKPLSPKERKLKHRSPNPNRQCVQKAYPILISMGEELAASGLAFLDLTDIFTDTEARIYYDDCHVNIQGYRMITDRLADFIITR